MPLQQLITRARLTHRALATRLLFEIERSGELLLRIEPCVEPVNDLCLMLLTGKNGNCSILYGDYNMICRMRGKAATGTGDTARWVMV
jgi:hypothetical protein